MGKGSIFASRWKKKGKKF